MGGQHAGPQRRDDGGEDGGNNPLGPGRAVGAPLFISLLVPRSNVITRCGMIMTCSDTVHTRAAWNTPLCSATDLILRSAPVRWLLLRALASPANSGALSSYTCG